METRLQQLAKTYRKQIHEELLVKVNKYVANYPHLIEEEMLKEVLKALFVEYPFYDENFDRKKLKDIDSKEYYELKFIEHCTTEYLSTEGKTKPEYFPEVFFENLDERVSSFNYRRNLQLNERKKLLGKYINKKNQDHLLKCIILNIETTSIFYGQWLEIFDYTSSPTETISLRKFLNLPVIPKPNEPLMGQSAVLEEDDVEANPNTKSLSKKDLAMLLFMLDKYDAFNFLSNKNMTSGIVKAVFETKSDSKAKEFIYSYFSLDKLKTYLSGEKNRKNKQFLADALKKIVADLEM